MTPEELSKHAAEREWLKQRPGERPIDTVARILLGVLQRIEDEKAETRAQKRKAERAAAKKTATAKKAVRKARGGS